MLSVDIDTVFTFQLLDKQGNPIPETAEKDAVVAFNVGDIHPLDLGTLLDHLGIAIRTGHHCAQPLMARCGVEGMARASFALYNTKEEIDALVAGIERVSKMF
jgi:cysteine desulfurase/selenocysteine lyase